MKKAVSFLLITAMLCALIPLSAVPALAYGDHVTDSQGVTYVLSDDGTYYIVLSYSQSATNPIPVIPAKINGLPVKEIGEEAFCCEDITSIVLPNSVTSLGEASFQNCTSLTSIVIPESVTDIGGVAFLGCTALTSVVIPKGVTSIGYGAFVDCENLVDMSIDADNPAFSSGDGALFNKDKTMLHSYFNLNKKTSYVIPDGVTEIGDDAFVMCSNLESVVIPESVTSIGNWTFFDCKGIKSMVIPGNVKYVGRKAFENWGDDQSIYFSMNAPGTEWCSEWFLAWSDGCEADIYFNGVKAPQKYVEAEYFTYSLSWDLASYGVFIASRSKTSLVIPSEINGLPITSLNGFLFAGHERLTSVVLPDSITWIGGESFSECTSLKSIIIPKSVTYIDRSAFCGWTRDQTVYFCVEDKPSDWGEDWNAYDAKVVWGYNSPLQHVNGDVDGNGDVDAIDYGLAKRCCLGTTDLTEDMIKRGDLNGNGTLEASEYGLIKRHVLGTYTIV